MGCVNGEDEAPESFVATGPFALRQVGPGTSCLNVTSQVLEKRRSLNSKLKALGLQGSAQTLGDADFDNHVASAVVKERPISIGMVLW